MVNTQTHMQSQRQRASEWECIMVIKLNVFLVAQQMYKYVESGV